MRCLNLLNSREKGIFCSLPRVTGAYSKYSPIVKYGLYFALWAAATLYFEN